MEDNYLHFNENHDLISALIGFHAEYTSSKELIKAIARTAERYKVPVYTHNSESKREVDDCIKRTKMTPTQYLNSLGIFEHGGGGVFTVCIYPKKTLKYLNKRKLLL